MGKRKNKAVDKQRPEDRTHCVLVQNMQSVSKSAGAKVVTWGQRLAIEESDWTAKTRFEVE